MLDRARFGVDVARRMKKSASKKKSGGGKPTPDKKEAARQVIDAVARDVRIRKALEDAGLLWKEFEAVLRSDIELKRAYMTARETIEEFWKIEKREQLHDAAMGRIPQQVTTPKGEIVTIYQASIPALIRGIDQDTPRPKPVETAADAEALTAFQAALKLRADVAAKKDGEAK